MKKPKTTFLLTISAMISFAVIFIIIGLYAFNWLSEKTLYEHRFGSIILIDKLRQSTEDLTRSALIYAASGDLRFKEKYHHILDARNGLTALQKFHYQKLHWNLFPFVSLSDDTFNPNESVFELTKYIGFSPEESAQLELIQTKTNTMIQIELLAMEEFEHGNGSKASSLKALSILSNASYLSSQAQILTLIDETQNRVIERTRLAVQKTRQQTKGLFLLLLSAIGAFAASSSARFFLEKTRASELEKISYHDRLTKLANRAYLDLYLKLVTSKANANEEIVALAFVDLNGFKAINDNFGHAEGDAVLKSVASSLLAHIRENDLVARYGGDEFVIVFVAPATHREQTLSRMKKALRTSFKQLGNDKQKTKVGAAVGISVYPYPSTSITKLLRHADEAMYDVKGIDTPLAVREYTP